MIAEDFSQKRRYVWEDIRPFLKLIKNKDKVFDIGCGNGRLFQELEKKNVDYLGIDFSQKLLEIARHKYPQAKFRLADITKDITWKNLKGFDSCFCIGVLHHIPGPKFALKILKNAYKSLKNNGYFYLTVWNMYQEKFDRALKRANTGRESEKELLVPYKISDGRKAVKQVDRYIYAFDKGELEDVIGKAGFKILESYYTKKGKKSNQRSGYNLCFVARK